MQERGYLRHFHRANRCDFGKFAEFHIDGRRLGWVTKELAALLPLEMDFFEPKQNGIALAPRFDSFAARTDALGAAARWIAARYGMKLRDENYAVLENWGDKPLAQIDRAAVPWFGVHGFGVHVNGFVKKPDGVYLWVSERAASRQIDPGMLDNLIGGGQPIGLTLEENLCKEAKEEAGIDATLARTAKLIRPIHYVVERHKGIRNDTLFSYDLELPDGYMPQNTDGEVASFALMPLKDVADLVHDTDKFKFNCNLIIIDFLMRMGAIPESHPEYAALKAALA